MVHLVCILGKKSEGWSDYIVDFKWEYGNFMSHLFKFEIKFDTAMLGHFGIQTSKSASTNSHMVALIVGLFWLAWLGFSLLGFSSLLVWSFRLDKVAFGPKFSSKVGRVLGRFGCAWLCWSSIFNRTQNLCRSRSWHLWFFKQKHPRFKFSSFPITEL